MRFESCIATSFESYSNRLWIVEPLSESLTTRLIGSLAPSRKRAAFRTVSLARPAPSISLGTLSSQVMGFLPCTTFLRFADRYGADHRIRTLPSAEEFRVMTFAQLMQALCMGTRQPVARSTLATRTNDTTGRFTLNSRSE